LAKVVPIEKLTFKEMLMHFELYSGLPDGLIQLPCPDTIRIKRKQYVVPKTMEEFTKSISYGQRLYLTREEENDIGAILRLINGYYYPLVTGQPWDEEKVFLIQKYVVNLQVINIYPLSVHFVAMLKETIDREEELLSREYTKTEKAAGIEKLQVFAELNSLDFLRDAMKCTVPEVLLTPYDECLVRFMNAKAIADYQDRYLKIQREQIETKPKYAK